MFSVALILFVLARYHSPQLAGAAAFFGILPGLLDLSQVRCWTVAGAHG